MYQIYMYLLALRSELVVLQRTEQILTNKFINAPGGSRPALEMLIKRVDAQLQSTGPRHSLLTNPNPDNESIDGSASRSDSTLEGATVEQVSTWVEQTSREFKQRQSQLQPVMIDLRRLRQEYAEIEAEYTDKKQIFEKQTVGLDIEKQALEKQCDVAQEECLREESRFHYLQNVLSLNKNRIEKVEQEQRWRDGNGRMMRDFTSFKTLYDNKLNQQEQLIKALRKRQRDLKELTESVGDQKKYFHTLDQILSAKLEYDQ